MLRLKTKQKKMPTKDGASEEQATLTLLDQGEGGRAGERYG